MVEILLFLLDIAYRINGFRNHFNGVTRALFVANTTAGTGVEVKFIPVAFSQFNNGVFRTCTKTAIAFEAVATAKATLGFKSCFSFG
jgi:hypothetical protein